MLFIDWPKHSYTKAFMLVVYTCTDSSADNCIILPPSITKIDFGQKFVRTVVLTRLEQIRKNILNTFHVDLPSM